MKYISKISERCSAHPNIMKVIFSGSIAVFFSSLLLSLMPVLFTELFGEAKVAGIIISLLTASQVFLWSSVFEYFSNKYSLTLTYCIALFVEMVGALLWLIFANEWGVVLYAATLFFRLTLFVTDPYLLKHSPRNEGGFWFGLRDELYALTTLFALLTLPFFFIPSTWEYLPVIIIGINLILLSILLPQAQNTTAQASYSFNLFRLLKKGWRFVQSNHKYPEFMLGTQAFEGVFYGSVWFLFPLHILSTLQNGGELTLGIYEFVTIFFAFVAGVLADRLDWKKMEVFSWIVTIVMAWAIVLFQDIVGLILIGFFIGLANSFFASAGYHALSAFTKDHTDEYAFSALSKIVANIGFMISPVVCGFLYQYFGFSIAFTFVASTVSVIGIWMIVLVYSTK